MAVASAVTGRLSDKIGRKPVILFCLSASMIGSAVKYFLRHTFWGFCIANFFNGLLSGSLPVALAYVSDVFSSKGKKSKEFGYVHADAMSLDVLFVVKLFSHDFKFVYGSFRKSVADDRLQAHSPVLPTQLFLVVSWSDSGSLVKVWAV